MSIKGDLQDMNLPSLVQMVCTDRRRAALLLSRDHEKGVLFFENGEIVHAQIGKLEGKEAVYHLLQWTDGTFNLGKQSRIPRYTINEPWRYLMLEGMKQMDEGNLESDTAVSTPKVLTRAQKKADEILGYQLINLLSNLEFSRAEMGEWQNRKRPYIALQTLASMINQITTFTDKEWAEPTPLPLKQIITQVEEKYPSIRLLQHSQNRVHPDVVVTLYRNWSAKKAARRQMFSGMARGFIEIMDIYAEHIISSFHSKKIAQQWRETSRSFIKEVTAVIDKFKF